jgi:hypothetical protein
MLSAAVFRCVRNRLSRCLRCLSPGYAPKQQRANSRHVPFRGYQRTCNNDIPFFRRAGGTFLGGGGVPYGQGKREFTTLDGMRGIAALAVVTRHAPLYFESVSIFVQSPMAKAPIAVGPFFESYLAVDFFFALSGFVLAHAYGHRLATGMSPGRFMAIRLIRLYPLYVVAC